MFAVKARVCGSSGRGFVFAVKARVCGRHRVCGHSRNRVCGNRACGLLNTLNHVTFNQIQI